MAQRLAQVLFDHLDIDDDYVLKIASLTMKDVEQGIHPVLMYEGRNGVLFSTPQEARRHMIRALAVDAITRCASFSIDTEQLVEDLEQLAKVHPNDKLSKQKREDRQVLVEFFAGLVEAMS